HSHSRAYRQSHGTILCRERPTADDPAGTYMQDLLGKVALISGGTTGIGLAAAKAFVTSGAKVVVAARNPERGIQAEQELRHLGGDAAFHRCDVSDPSS